MSFSQENKKSVSFFTKPLNFVEPYGKVSIGYQIQLNNKYQFKNSFGYLGFYKEDKTKEGINKGIEIRTEIKSIAKEIIKDKSVSQFYHSVEVAYKNQENVYKRLIGGWWSGSVYSQTINQDVLICHYKMGKNIILSDILIIDIYSGGGFKYKTNVITDPSKSYDNKKNQLMPNISLGVDIGIKI